MDASAIAAFALLLSAPAAAADGERSAANAGRPAAAAAEAKGTAGSATLSPGGGIDCEEEYRPDWTVVLAGRLGGQRLPLIPVTAAPGALSFPEPGGSIGPVSNGSDAARCSLFMNRREAAECLE